MSRHNLRGDLPGAGKRRTQDAPASFYRSNVCELPGCACEGRGKADVAIQDQNKQPIGYVCQRGYIEHLEARQLDQFSQYKQQGELLNPVQPSLNEQHTAHRFADLVSELDRYADSTHEREERDA